MRTQPSTQMIHPEVIPRRERVEDLACVYCSVLVIPSILGLSEHFGCLVTRVSQHAFFSFSSVNIPWAKGGKGDEDYLYAFDKVVMPIAREFAPEIVLSR